LARDCVILIKIILKLKELFMSNYGVVLGQKKTISSIAFNIYFSSFYPGRLKPGELNNTPIREKTSNPNLKKLVRGDRSPVFFYEKHGSLKQKRTFLFDRHRRGRRV